MKEQVSVKFSVGIVNSARGLLFACLLCSTSTYGQAPASTASAPETSGCRGFGQLAELLGSAIAPETQARTVCGHSSVQQTIVVNGVTRTFMLYVPDSYRAGSSGLVIALHGRGESVADIESGSHLDDLSNEKGFAVAYPVGLVDLFGTPDWNYFYSPFYVNGPDDVGFLRAIIDTLQTQIRPDRRRIYVAGSSAGGFMAQRAGVELSDRVAAIAVVEGGVFVFAPGSPQSVPAAAEPISVLLLKGDQDAANQYCGAVFPTFGVTEASADQDFDYWTGDSANRCADVKPATPLCLSIGVGDAQANVTPGTPSSLVSKKAMSCKGHSTVRLYRLLGGQDIWNLNPMNIPGQVPFNPELNEHTGVTTNQILWKFFDAHPKPEKDDER